MTIETAEKVAEFLMERGLVDEDGINVHEAYSGRGMYGRTTAGLVVRDRAHLGLIGYAIAALGISPDEIPGFSDNLGYSTIYY